jgi:hypothetical protein
MRKTRGVVSQRLILPTAPLIVLNDGTPIYPIMGSDPEGQEGSEDEDPDEEDGDDEDEGEESEEDEKPKPKSKSKPKETEAQKIRRLNKENQTRRLALEEAERKLRAIEDADKSELEIAKRDLEELQAKTKGHDETLNNLRIENAFLKLSGYNWHDPDDALEYLRKTGEVTIDDDGTVDGLEQAVKDLAKKKPYLLKAKEDEEDEEPKSRRTSGARGPSGASVGSGPGSKKGQAKSAQRKTLIEKYGLGYGR